MGTDIGTIRASATSGAPAFCIGTASAKAGLRLSRGLLVAAFLACALTGVGGVAQSQSQSQASDQCAAQPSPADEIACLRRALKEKTDALARTQSAAPAAPRSAASQPVAPAATTAPARAAPPAVAASAPPPAPMVADRGENLGQEQLPGSRSRDDAAAQNSGVPAVVLSAREDREGLLRITLENGQVWKQFERPSTQILLKEQQKYSVEIARSGFGGYRMYFPDLHRTIAVKRII